MEVDDMDIDEPQLYKTVRGILQDKGEMSGRALRREISNMLIPGVPFHKQIKVIPGVAYYEVIGVGKKTYFLKDVNEPPGVLVM